jgi:hypothetical protein
MTCKDDLSNHKKEINPKTGFVRITIGGGNYLSPAFGSRWCEEKCIGISSDNGPACPTLIFLQTLLTNRIQVERVVEKNHS